VLDAVAAKHENSTVSGHLSLHRIERYIETAEQQRLSPAAIGKLTDE